MGAQRTPWCAASVRSLRRRSLRFLRRGVFFLSAPGWRWLIRHEHPRACSAPRHRRWLTARERPGQGRGPWFDQRRGAALALDRPSDLGGAVWLSILRRKDSCTGENSSCEFGHQSPRPPPPKEPGDLRAGTERVAGWHREQRGLTGDKPLAFRRREAEDPVRQSFRHLHRGFPTEAAYRGGASAPVSPLCSRCCPSLVLVSA